MFPSGCTGKFSWLHLFVKTAARSALLPILTSECPGWICYAEKRHPESLPYISTVKSAQEIMGTFLKFALASKCVIENLAQ